MSTTDAVESIALQLDAATSFVAVFGIVSGDVPAKKKRLGEQFAYLVKLVHPDKAPGDAKAAEAFDRLRKMRDAAEAAIEAGTYEKPFAPGTATTDAKTVELRSPAGVYRLDEKPLCAGDFSVIYRALATRGDGIADVLVKVASSPPDNARLDREVQIAKRFHAADADSRLGAVARFTPEILDSFMVAGEKGRRFRANVVRHDPALVSVARIIELFPKGLPPQDAAWVARRILAQVTAAAMAGVVHAAVLPEHVLVDPVKHEPLHVGWAHAVDVGGKVTRVVTNRKAFYPPEVFAKEPAAQTLDVFTAGKTIVALLGGDATSDALPAAVPREMAAVVRKCVAVSPRQRFQTGRQAFDEMTKVARGLWGSEYRQLVLPGK